MFSLNILPVLDKDGSNQINFDARSSVKRVELLDLFMLNFSGTIRSSRYVVYVSAQVRIEKLFCYCHYPI